MEQAHKEEPSIFVSSSAHHMEVNPSSSSKDEDAASSESSERRVTTKTTITTKRQQRLANHGMGFLLQQMRNTSSSTSTTKSTENSEAEPSGKKPRLEEGNQGKLLAESTSNLPTSTEQTATIRARDDLPLPSGQEFFTNLRPLQVISDCFCAGTTPDFGLHIRRFIGENNYVRSCKWSPDGRWLIADSLDRAVRVFAFEDGKLRLHRKIPFGGLVYDLQWSPSATTAGVPQFACTSHGQPIHCWTTPDDGQSSAMTFRGTNDKDELDSAYSLCYSLDGRQLLAGYRGLLRFFDVTRPGRQVREIKTWQKGSMGAQQKGLLSALAMCPTFDGVFAVGSYGGSLGLYSTQTNGCDCLLQSNGAGPAITHLHYSSTGTQLFVGYRKSPLIKCFDLRMASTGRVLAAFRRDAHTNQRFHFQLDPHDRYLYSGSSGGRVLIYDLKKDQMQSDQMELETLANEEELGRPANWHVNCSEAAVTGLSLHPQEQLVAISTGQRLFPDIMAQLFSADQQCEGNHSPPPSDMEMELADDDEEGEEADGYVGRAKGSALDNSIKLYNMMMP